VSRTVRQSSANTGQANGSRAFFWHCLILWIQNVPSVPAYSDSHCFLLETALRPVSHTVLCSFWPAGSNTGILSSHVSSGPAGPPWQITRRQRPGGRPGKKTHKTRNTCSGDGLSVGRRAGKAAVAEEWDAVRH